MTAVRRAVTHFLTSTVAEVRCEMVAVACSGGADSLALAEAAVHDGRLAVHGLVVDHGLQAGSAAVALRAAEQLTAMGCAAARVLTVRVPGTSNVEAAARTARYGALAAARPHPDALVLLGHTMDDQAETVLLGLGRGSGPRSIAGMRELDPPWGRPLLGVRRADTVAACAELGLTPWEDPHNADPRFRRVRLRSEVLPLLEDVLAGGVAPALARTAAQLREDGDALDGMAADLLAAAAVAPAATGAQAPAVRSLDVATLAAAPAALRRRAVRAWLLASGVPRLSDAQLRSADALLDPRRWRGQGAVALPGDVGVSRRAGRLVVEPRPVRGPGGPVGSGPAAWKAAGNVLVGSTRGKAQVESAELPLGRYADDIAAVLISEEQIREKTAELAAKVAADYQEQADESDLLLVGVLKGAVMFMTDLARALPIPVQLEFMAVSSYGSATSSSGVVRILKDLDRDIAGRHVLIVEDIIDSGLTLSWLLKNLATRSPASLQVCTLLRKPDALKVDVPAVRYVGFDIPNEFVVGYGLDYAERYRDLPCIGTLEPRVYTS